MTGKLLKSVCPACGAPISRSEHRYGYVCKFCGTEFFPEDGSDIPIFAESPITGFHSEYSDYSEPLDQSLQKKKSLGIWVAIAVFGFIMIASISGLFNTKSSSTRQNLPTAITMPLMLATLPKAETAGNAVAFNNFELVLEPNIRISENILYFNFTIQNWNDQVMVLRYKPNNFIVYDDLGNTYPLSLGNCDVDLPYMERQIELEPYKIVRFESSNSWCGNEDLIPAYSGVIPINAKQIYFHIEDFGEFEDITFVFDL